MSTTIEPWLREVLRCPACRSTLLDAVGDDGEPALRCSARGPVTHDPEPPGSPAPADPQAAPAPGCGRTYRVDRGVPVLLVDEGVLPAAGA